jgi:hypothetical protein
MSHPEKTNQRSTTMKQKILQLLAAVIVASNLSAAPESRTFGLKVKEEGKASYDNDAVTQTRKLNLALSLAGKEPAPGLVVKWTVYGHTRKDHKQVVIESGELKTSLEGGKSVTLTTPQVTIKGVREHSVSTGRGRSRRSKKVPASGNEYFGYSVEVSNGTAVVAEAYSKPSLKKSS